MAFSLLAIRLEDFRKGYAMRVGSTSVQEAQMLRGIALAICMQAISATAFVQTTDGRFDNALSTSLASVAKSMHATIRRDLAEAAESMPPEDYSFKPTPQVRSFAKLIGHVANANFFFCSQASGARPDRNEVNNDVTIKGLLLFLFAFVAGYLVALLREHITLRRERNSERSYQRSTGQHS